MEKRGKKEKLERKTDSSVHERAQGVGAGGEGGGGGGEEKVERIDLREST